MKQELRLPACEHERILTAFSIGLPPLFRILLMLITVCGNARGQSGNSGTLCQEVGQNFTPDITIGSSLWSVTNTSSLGVNDWTNKKIRVNGTLVVDSDFSIHSCILAMEKNAVIQINGAVHFSSYDSKYFRCINSWKGFVLKGGQSDFWFNRIEDALVAIDVQSANAHSIIAGNTFNRNDVGVNANGVALNAIMVSNRFDCTSNLNGLSRHSKAGIQLTNCPAASIGWPGNDTGYRNVFSNQANGLLSSNSMATVWLSTFYSNAYGVHADGGNLVVEGSNGGLRTTFIKDTNDIYVNSCNLEVFNCYMDSCKLVNITSRKITIWNA